MNTLDNAREACATDMLLNYKVRGCVVLMLSTDCFGGIAACCSAHDINLNQQSSKLMPHSLIHTADGEAVLCGESGGDAV